MRREVDAIRHRFHHLVGPAFLVRHQFPPFVLVVEVDEGQLVLRDLNHLFYLPQADLVLDRADLRSTGRISRDMVNPRVVTTKVEEQAGASTYVLCVGGRLGNKFEPLLHVHPVAAVLGDFLTGAAR